MYVTRLKQILMKMVSKYILSLLTADEPTEHREPAGDSGLSARSEERSGHGSETGLFLSLGSKCDTFN